MNKSNLAFLKINRVKFGGGSGGYQAECGKEDSN